MKAVLPEPEESPDKPRRGRGGKKRGKSVEAMMAEFSSEEPKVPEHTAMEMAWKAALDRAGSTKKSNKKDEKSAEAAQVQEELLSRTLEQRK
ncbi:MAG: hypothetical protein HQ525_00030, partial [Anaerolineae bacterium]|nr:hypothetical protein [Anaerolineae bacterium]